MPSVQTRRGALLFGVVAFAAFGQLRCAKILDIGDLNVAAGAPEGGNADAAVQGIPYMIGYKVGNQTSAPATVESWLGRSMDVVGNSMTTVSYIAPGPYKTASGKLTLLQIDFPILSIFGEPNPLSDMAVAASGGYDPDYSNMAIALSKWDNPILSVSIGSQFNGGDYPWSSGVGTNATAANYVAAFQRIAVIIRRNNPAALIQWSMAWGGADPTPYWPGKYDADTNPGGVDVISTVFYEGILGKTGKADWATIQSGGGIDLDWMVSYARQQGVKIALSEYAAGAAASGGEGTGTGLDDGAWVASSIAWMNAQPAGFFLWEEWSGYPAADDLITPGADPNEEAQWIAAWRDTRFTGTWWKGTPPP
jgi:hypothetical protein